MWHVTCDTWHVTQDMWHVTRDKWHVTHLGGVNILSKFQLPSSYCLWFMILWRSGGKGWINQLMSTEAVYRTAPATPGLLIIHNMDLLYNKFYFVQWIHLNIHWSLTIRMNVWKYSREERSFLLVFRENIVFLRSLSSSKCGQMCIQMS